MALIDISCGGRFATTFTTAERKLRSATFIKARTIPVSQSPTAVWQYANRQGLLAVVALRLNRVFTFEAVSPETCAKLGLAKVKLVSVSVTKASLAKQVADLTALVQSMVKS